MFIMLGYEGETVEDIEATVSIWRASPDTFLTTVAYPIKGTPTMRRSRATSSPINPGKPAATAI
jgi:hypothetical protein